jgi:hypothetical protein
MRALLLSLAVAVALLGCHDLVAPLGDGAAASTGAASDAEPDDPTSDWPDASRTVAKDLTREYGTPENAAADMLTWGARGPFKRIIVFRDPVPHDFPKPHADVVEEVVDFKVPAAKMSDLAAFDGSILVDRTKGELASRCADEATNMLAMSLAMQILLGTTTPDDARRDFASTVASGNLPTRLGFDPPEGDQGDPDVPAP